MNKQFEPFKVHNAHVLRSIKVLLMDGSTKTVSGTSSVCYHLTSKVDESADVYDLLSLIVKDIGKQNVFQMTHLDHVEDRKGTSQYSKSQYFTQSKFLITKLA